MATLKKTKKLVFKTNYRLMQVKSIAECSKGSILQYFWPLLSYHLPLRFFFEWPLKTGFTGPFISSDFFKNTFQKKHLQRRFQWELKQILLGEKRTVDWQNKPLLCFIITFTVTIWASTRENLSSMFANNKGADQPAHPRSLISAFVICVLKSIVSRLAMSKISIF